MIPVWIVLALDSRRALRGSERGRSGSMPSPFDDFDFSVLDSAGYKEDAVREDLIAPLLRAVGFSASGHAQMRRSVALEHPFVSIGSIPRKIKIIPDYLLTFGDRVVCSLEAKAPSENVIGSDHLSQAYTYAVHRDVRADHYALCNGRRFVLFRTADMSRVPAFEFDLSRATARWAEIADNLHPFALYLPRSGEIAKDFGLHLERLGMRRDIRLLLTSVPVYRVGRLSRESFTMMCTADSEGQTYAASFDFDEARFRQLAAQMPPNLVQALSTRLDRWPAMVEIPPPGPTVTVNIRARLGSKLHENEHEIYRPFIVQAFS